MPRNWMSWLVAALLSISAPIKTVVATAQEWSVAADVAESCSCEVSCPCNFGQPTASRCDGSRLIAIDEGHYGGVDLSGVTFVVTFEMREWSKIYVDDRISDVQMEALEQLLPVAFGGFHRGMRALRRVPLTIDRTDDTVRFSVPESTVEIRLMRGMDGRAITIDGLPSPVYVDYTQYESVVHTHSSSDAEFSYLGTNGFTSRMEVDSADGR